MVAHLLWEQRVAGSNPVTPTKNLAPWPFNYSTKHLNLQVGVKSLVGAKQNLPSQRLVQT